MSRFENLLRGHISRAPLKQLMQEPPISSAVHAELMRKKHEARRQMEDIREMKAESKRNAI